MENLAETIGTPHSGAREYGHIGIYRDISGYIVKIDVLFFIDF